MIYCQDELPYLIQSSLWLKIEYINRNGDLAGVRFVTMLKIGLPWWLRWYRICLKAGDPGSIPGLGRSPGEGNGSPL